MKFIYLLSFFIVLSLFACGENDIEEALIGTWQLQEITVSGCQLTERNFTFELDENGCIAEDVFAICFDQTFTFNSDGSLSNNFDLEIPALEDLGIDLDALGVDLADLDFLENLGIDLDGLGINLDDLDFDLDDLNSAFDSIGDISTDATFMRISDNVVQICDGGDCTEVSYFINGDSLTLEGLNDVDGCSAAMLTFNRI